MRMPKISFVSDHIWCTGNTLFARFRASGRDTDEVIVFPYESQSGKFQIKEGLDDFRVIFRVIDSPADSFDIDEGSQYVTIGSFYSEKSARSALEGIEKVLYRKSLGPAILLKPVILAAAALLGVALLAGSAKNTDKTVDPVHAATTTINPSAISTGLQGVDRRIDPKALPVSQSWKFGNPKGKPVYIFSDPDCPFCKELEATFSPLGRDYHFMVFPVPLKGMDSLRAIEAIACTANPPETWHKWMSDGTPFPPLKNEGAECAKLAGMAARGNLETFVSQGFSGTPTIVREDGVVQPGALSADDLRAWLEKSK